MNLFDCEFRTHTTRRKETVANNEQTEDLDGIEDAENDANEVADKAAAVSEESQEKDTTNWIYNQENLQKTIENIQAEWTQASVK